MPPLNFYDYPGYAEAVERETTLRITAFVQDYQWLCGLKVKPMTLRHLLLLDGVDSPFVSGSECRAYHIPQFLWVVSAGYAPLNRGMIHNAMTRIRRRRLTRYCRKLKVSETISAIRSYVDAAFWDSQKGGQKEKAPWASWPALLAHQIGKTYGVAPAGQQLETIMDMPLVVVWQLMRCIQKDANPDSSIINRSDMVVHEYLARKNGEEWPSSKT